MRQDVLKAIPAAARLLPPDGQPPDQDRRSPAEKEAVNAWYSKVRWWKALVRCGFVPTFAAGGDGTPVGGGGAVAEKRTSEEAFGSAGSAGSGSNKSSRPS